MHRLLSYVVLCAFALAACTPRGAVSVIQSDVKPSYVAPIFMATTRAKSDSPWEYTKDRTSQVSLARYDISVPPTHKAGAVEWPKGNPNIATDMVTLSVTEFKSRRAFISDANTFKRTGQEAIVFVHGYNNTFAEGLYRFAQVAHDVQIQGPKYHYSWPSAGDARGYVYDRDSILFARDGLEQLLTDVAKTNSQGIFLVAHSIGSALVMETLRQMAIAGNPDLNGKLRGIIMISPDIDVNVFVQSLSRIKPQPEPLLIFVSKRDLALKFSSFLTGSANRLGVIENLDNLKDSKVEIIDVSAFDGSGVLNHSVAITSPALLNILKNRKVLEDVLDSSSTSNKGTNILGRTIQTVNDVTQIILNP